MILKETNQKTSHLSIFDVADATRKEPNLTRLYAYLLAKDPYVLKAFLERLGIDYKDNHAQTILNATKIMIEKDYACDRADTPKGAQRNKKNFVRGRTDIEIEIPKLGVYIIIECKIKKNKPTAEQFEKYAQYFKDKPKNYKKIFVFISAHKGIYLTDKNISIFDLTWRDTIADIEDLKFGNSDLRKQFLAYYGRGYGMGVHGEILIQDLSDKDEIRRFKDNSYRREKLNTTPLYFAPYFTRKSGVGEGIQTISSILGIITTKNISWTAIQDDCTAFLKNAGIDESESDALLKKWRKSINIAKIKDVVFTYFFLGNPVKISPSLKKGKGEYAKNWVGPSRIPQNRRVSVLEFIRRMGMAPLISDNTPVLKQPDKKSAARKKATASRKKTSK